eukprot:GHVN01067155.1.p1 GENE.GHVN01067155.1~~GHVN01067155.1.p1  ORF type:complete len:444 (-),score=66.73 GHVN01067155.1:506-1837(-)
MLLKTFQNGFALSLALELPYITRFALSTNPVANQPGARFCSFLQPSFKVNAVCTGLTRMRRTAKRSRMQEAQNSLSTDSKFVVVAHLKEARSSASETVAEVEMLRLLGPPSEDAQSLPPLDESIKTVNLDYLIDVLTSKHNVVIHTCSNLASCLALAATYKAKVDTPIVKLDDELIRSKRKRAKRKVLTDDADGNEVVVVDSIEGLDIEGVDADDLEDLDATASFGTMLEVVVPTRERRAQPPETCSPCSQIPQVPHTSIGSAGISDASSVVGCRRGGEENKVVRVYTDGCALGNGAENARAGYGVWFGDHDSRNESGPLPFERQTNQRAELFALHRAIVIFRSLTSSEDNPSAMLICTDSDYSIKCLTLWRHPWQKNGWKSTSGKPVMNLDLIRPLIDDFDDRIKRYGPQSIRLQHVKGHAGIYGNEKADQLAKKGAMQSRL